MQENYQKARRLGEREAARRTALKQNPYLPALSEILGENAAVSTIPVGTFEIPADRIIGTRTLGRQNAFAANYMPLLEPGTEFATKWTNLYHAQEEEGIRDAVKTYEYLGNFYVQEGNKRVSVLKFLEVPTVLAEVIRVLPAEWEDNEMTRAYREFLKFYYVAPTYAIRLTREGGYAKICEAFQETMKERWPVDKVRRLRHVWYRFQQIYKSKMPETSWDKCADAFPTYLSVYGLESLSSDSEELLAQRVEKLRDEFDAAGADITVVEEPIPEKVTPGPISLLKSIVTPARAYTPDYPMPVAFMYRGNRETSAWIRQHDEARATLSESFGGTVSTFFYENLENDTALRLAVDDAVARDAKVIFTVSADLMEETVRCALHYPQVRFLNCSLNESHPTVPTYFARRYEGKFLLGALAAIAARNHRIGYLADLPIYGTVADINAFAIGASLIDPKARVYVQWPAEHNHDWRKSFREQEVLVVCGLDRGANEQEQGLFWTGWDGEYRKLADAKIDWAEYYRRMIRAILEGGQKSFEKSSGGHPLNFWYGLSSGIIQVKVSEDLPYHTRKMIALLSSAILAGTLDPFEGELRSQEGMIQSADSPKLPMSEIIRMNWLNDNVVGAIPETGAFAASSQSVISVSGVRRADAEK
ncbi:MAG: BMP family ABC transporter substrate-binding protein [Lachnospiraceae bacterium]|nr:BMP family ABC transporter substrate-binding protein [Lachnospiraceae bacterium]